MSLRDFGYCCSLSPGSATLHPGLFSVVPYGNFAIRMQPSYRIIVRQVFRPASLKMTSLRGDAYLGEVWITRLVIQRGMAAIYFLAFLAVVNQFKPLLGERGLLPVPDYLGRTSWRTAPGIFRWRYSDRLLDVVAWTGIVVSVLAFAGFTERGPGWVSIGAWLLLYVLYLSW